jgi:hypothetical protein
MRLARRTNMSSKPPLQKTVEADIGAVAESPIVVVDDDDDDENAEFRSVDPVTELDCSSRSSNEEGDDEDGEKVAEGENDENDEENSDDGDIDFKIMHILARQSRTQGQWRLTSDSMNTQELYCGSVLKQPDSEYFSNSEDPIEKYFIKWEHSSFLHCSWETYSDLLELVGATSVNANIKRFNQREAGASSELFEDLAAGEFFPPQYLVIERIVELDVNHDEDDKETSKEEVICESAVSTKSKHLTKCQSELKQGSQQTDGNGCVTPLLAELSCVTDEELQWLLELDPSAAWVTVKWAGQCYSQISIERLSDLVAMDIDYLLPIVAFYRFDIDVIGYIVRFKALVYRRDSNPPKPPGSRVDRSLAALNAAFPEEGPSYRGRSLRDYQWNGIQWMLYNWSEKRNRCLYVFFS